MNLIKKFLELRKKRQLAKYQRMNSEILCAIVHQVNNEQKEQEVKLPVFYEVSQRYNNLNIKTPLDLKTVYQNLFKEGMVSGIEL